VLAVLAVVEILALVAPIATWSPISKADLDLALLLVSLTVTYSLFVLGWEKARRLLLFERAPAMTPDLRATWCFASAILLPPPLAAVVTVVSASGEWPSQPAGTRRLYRFVCSSGASILAATVASWIFRHHLTLAAALPAAAAVWLAIGAGATGLAMCASGQFDAAKAMLHFHTHRLEFITMAVATAEYAAQSIGMPLLIWLSLPITVGIQRYFTTAELRAREMGARPMGEDAWLHVAQVIVEAAETVSVLRIESADPHTARTVV